MDEKNINKLMERISILIKLSALNALAGKKPIDKIKTLSEVGLKPSEMADILGQKINYITATLSNIKKASAKKSSTK